MPPDVWQADDAMSTPNEPAQRARYKRGDRVERVIDGAWFPARVTDCYVDGGVEFYDLRYEDDGNTERDVDGDEVRKRAAGSTPVVQPRRPAHQPSPLDDDEDAPKEPTATVTHDNGGAFVVNGEGTKVGSGGGLRGIRFLRESVNMQ